MSGKNVLVAINNCTCEGYDQVYECRVTGSGAVWDCVLIAIPLINMFSSRSVHV